MSSVNMARSMKKIELPRPLKTSTGGSIHTRNSILDIKINSIEDLVGLTEAVACQISQGTFDRCLQANVTTMYQHLKNYGAQLESTYKDLLNRSFAVFRNGCQDEKLDKRSRIHLLELVELRARQWQSSDNMSHYYKNRVMQEPQAPTETILINDATVVLSPQAVEPPTLLGPGEIIKASGKFTKPTKIVGKNYSKDEVVIRNSDSGKVMGIKGRRVHMIEELSDTVISFQRVTPGAKERLVQITGPNEENVNHAKHLIGDTIRRNASPVRLSHGNLSGGPNAGFRGSANSLNSSNSDESSNPIIARDNSTSSQRMLLHSMSTNDAALREYRHTVYYGENCLKITGAHPDIVRTAKLVLDEYFARCEMEQPVEGGGDFFTLARSQPRQDLFTGLASAGSPLPQTPTVNRADEYNGIDDEVFLDSKNIEENANETTFRRARFSRTTSEKKEGDENKIRFSNESLLHYAHSPLSRQSPLLLATFPPEVQRKVCMDFNADTYLKKIKLGGTTSIMTNYEDIPDSPEPE